MTKSRDDILHPHQSDTTADFPFAPAHWTPEITKKIADESDMELVEDHWQVVRAIQEYHARNDGNINVRELLDALDEKFHSKGGKRYLYLLLPGGPVAQGCRLAGLPPPAGSIDKGFGSVQ